MSKNQFYDQKVQGFVLCEEDIMNLKHCVERTKDMWEAHVDLWPFTIMRLIQEWEETK